MMNYKNMIFKGKQTSNLQRIIHEYEKGFETCYFLDKEESVRTWNKIKPFFFVFSRESDSTFTNVCLFLCP